MLPCRKLSRREFLKVLAASGVVLGSSCVFSDVLRNGLFKAAETQGSSKSTGTEMTAVSVVKGTNLREMTRNAIDAIGGISSIVDPGDRVFIKPNYVGLDTRTGICTKPEIVLAVAEECLKGGASQVVIGEGGQVPIYDAPVEINDQRYPNHWSLAMALDGTENLFQGVTRLNNAYGEKVFLKNLNASTPYWVFVPSITEFGWIAVSSYATEADKVISIPVLKTHHDCAVTLSIKNFMGITPLWLYGSPRGKLHECDLGVEQCFIDVAKGVGPDLAVIDASIGVEGNGPGVGPEAGTTVDVRDRLGYWLVLASKDLVAADSTATRIIGHDPQYVKQLRMAHSQGLGEMREEGIKIIGPEIEEVQMNWIPSEHSGYPQ